MNQSTTKEISRKEVTVQVSETRMLFQYEPFKVEISSVLTCNETITGQDIKNETDRLKELIKVVIDKRVSEISNKE